MGWLNAALGFALGALLFPFRSFPPIVGLSAVALAVAVATLLVFRATSNQPAIAAVKRQISAAIFEIRLFNDDPRAIVRAQGHILRHSLTYLRLTLPPVAWMAVPLVLLLSQLQYYYGYDGLAPGRPAIVKARLNSAPASPPAIALEAPAGLRIETPLLWIPSEREAAWRVVADRTGDYEVRITVNGRVAGKTVHVSDRVGWRSPDRRERSVLNELLHPAEPPLERDVPLEAISVAYPQRVVSFLGWDAHWSIVLLALSVLFTFALRNAFGVVT
jgi:hypothetical protein